MIEKPICPCGTTDQTIDHLLFECELLNKGRDNLISTVIKTDVWPIRKNKLIKKQFKIFPKLTKEISFDKINEVINPKPGVHIVMYRNCNEFIQGVPGGMDKNSGECSLC